MKEIKQPCLRSDAYISQQRQIRRIRREIKYVVARSTRCVACGSEVELEMQIRHDLHTHGVFALGVLVWGLGYECEVRFGMECVAEGEGVG